MNFAINKTVIVGVIAAVFVTLAAAVLYVGVASGGSISSEGSTAEPPSGGFYRDYTFFSATTTSATSTDVNATFDANGRRDDGALVISGAKSVDVYFSRGDTTGQGNTGQSKFEIEVTPDDTNWYDFNWLIGDDVAQTATSSYTIGAATSTNRVSLDLDNSGFLKMRCIVIETTDGEHSCTAYVEY